MTARSILTMLTIATVVVAAIGATSDTEAAPGRPRVIDHTGPQVITGGWERNWRITTSPHQFNPCCRERVREHRSLFGKSKTPTVRVPPPAR